MTNTKTKRIKHCYPRQEVYHRFIHDDEYYYSNRAHAISSKGNYLSLGDIGKYKSVSDIEEYWYPNNRVFAIIDRENKKILVSHKYRDLTHELLNAIPDNYEVFHCKNDIPFCNILHYGNIDALAKLHLQYSVECYIEKYLYHFYAVIKGKTTLHKDIDNIVKDKVSSDYVNNYIKHYYYEYAAIKQFVRKYKVKQRTWYNEVLNDKFKLYFYYPNSWSHITIQLPTVKQVLTNTIFIKSQQEIFRKKYFYTKYCYGRGIPYTDVDKYFGTSITYNEIIQYFNSRKLYLNPEWIGNIDTWNDIISKTKIIEDNIHIKYINEQIDKSEANYKNALKELNKLESEFTINNWREYKRNIKQNSVTYEKFIAPTRRNHRGIWTTVTIHSNSKTFANTQLRLEGNVIRTSKNVTVTLEEGIKIYRLFNKCRTKCPDCLYWPTSSLGDIKVGIYNLRFIAYKDKITDFGDSLNYKQWVIQIGCHSLWLDDIENFIQYYHLEDKFDITKKNN